MCERRDPRHWYGEFPGLFGRFDEEVQQYLVARRLDPDSVPLRVDLAAVLIRSGQLDGAHAAAG